jgi:cobalt-zinc-cadmium efflux system protein
LSITLGLTVLYMGAEVVGGLWSGSLALLADAGHMLSDSAALALSLFAIHMAQRPATPERTYGFYRAEILAALANGAGLLAIAVLITIEAVERIQQPREVMGVGMLLVASGGLVMNLLAMGLLHGARDESLNVRGAWLHVVADAMGSVGAMVAGVLVWKLGWLWADPLASLLIVLLVVHSAWALVREAVAVLMEGTPGDIDVDAVRDALQELPDVEGVHDLHVWLITSAMPSASVHLVTGPQSDRDRILGRARGVLLDRFGITHSTIQIEGTYDCEGCAAQ